MDNEVIQAKGLVKTYNQGKENEVKAVDGMDFEIHKGDFVAIIGPSGSGKSTLLHLLGLLDLPDQGELIINGHNVMDVSPRNLSKMRRKVVGFVFQTFNLISRTSAYKNVVLPLVYSGVSFRKRKQIARDLLKQVGLEKRMGHWPNQLSGGERQRVAIARALANNPEVILADEPTGNLDTKSGEEIMKILNDLNKQGVTIIVVTHDVEIAAKAKIVIKIRDGKVEQIINNQNTN